MRRSRHRRRHGTSPLCRCHTPILPSYPTHTTLYTTAHTHCYLDIHLYTHAMPLNSSFFPSILYNTEYSPLGSTVSRGNGAERSSPPCRSCASTPDSSSNSGKYIYIYVYVPICTANTSIYQDSLVETRRHVRRHASCLLMLKFAVITRTWLRTSRQSPPSPGQCQCSDILAPSAVRGSSGCPPQVRTYIS